MCGRPVEAELPGGGGGEKTLALQWRGGGGGLPGGIPPPLCQSLSCQAGYVHHLSVDLSDG